MPFQPAFAHTVSPQQPRTRALADNAPMAARAVDLLQGFGGFTRLAADDAQTVVRYLREISFTAGDVLFRAGDRHGTSYLLLLLEGEVSVEGGGPGAAPVAISVLGPGSVLGEMAMLDGAPRSATCTALSTVQAAGLARRGLERLIDEHPRVAAQLMVGLAQRLSDRLRALGEQLQLYAELEAAGPSR